MKHTSSYYYVQSKSKNGKIANIGHSQDEETKEIFYKFLDKKKAFQLLEDERKTSPEYEYRIVKETHIFEPLTNFK